MSTDNANEMTTLQFLQALYGVDAPGWLILFRLPDQRTVCVEAANLAFAAEITQKQAREYDMYFGIGLQRNKPTTGRGSGLGVCAIPGLWADIDLKGAAHTETRLPASREDMTRLLAKLPLPPTIMVNSGHGYHVWWLFKELWTLDTEEERLDAQALVRDFQYTLKRWAGEFDWKIDTTSDLARILRLPGSVNHKGPKFGEQIKTVAVEEFDDNNRYDPSEFDQFLIETPTEELSYTPDIDKDYPASDLRKVAAECAFMRHCRDDAVTLPEPEWYTMLSITARCVDGNRWSHTWSKPHKGYSRKNTDEKIRHALEFGPRTCTRIYEDHGDEWCRECQHRGKLSSPIVLGFPNRIPGNTDKLPEIDAKREDLTNIVPEVWEAVSRSNEPEPHLFQRGGLFTRIQLSDLGAPVLSVVGESAFRGIIARCIWWYRWVGESEKRKIPALPPMPVVRDMISAQFIPLPYITRVVEAPVFGGDGTIHTDPGYHPNSRCYYWGDRFEVPPLPEKPSDKDIEKARSIIVDEIMHDFPFTGPSERAHAIAALLLPFARELIDGPTPLHLIEAPTPGTGKSLLADVIAMPATGRVAATMTEGRDEDEWRKRITAALLESPSHILLDNVRRKLDSASLAAALTSQTWKDRVLGRSEMTSLPIRCVWMATGNNPSLTTEMSRRVARIRLDAKVARPWEREGFRHEDLRGWIKVNRGIVVWAALTLIKAWVVRGMVRGKRTLGQYEAWAGVMGGILGTAGMPGFLENLTEVYEAADEETSEWEEFFSVWWDKHRGMPQLVKDLYGLAQERDLLLLVRGAGSEQSQKIRMGRCLSQMRDRQIGEWRLVLGGTERRTKSPQYRLAVTDPSKPAVNDSDDSPF